MSRSAHSFLLVATCLSTAGCGTSWLSDRQTNPVIEEYQATGFGGTERLVGILATTASRRTILVNLDERDPGRIGFVCAEPPPDVSEAFAKSLAAELSAQGLPAGGVGTVSGDTRFASTMGTAVGTLLYRTQSLQFLRDQTYILCLEYFNGVIKSDSEYMEHQRYVVEEFKELLKEKFKHMPTVTVNLAMTVPSPALPSPYIAERQRPAAEQ